MFKYLEVNFGQLWKPSSDIGLAQPDKHNTVLFHVKQHTGIICTINFYQKLLHINLSDSLMLILGHNYSWHYLVDDIVVLWCMVTDSQDGELTSGTVWRKCEEFTNKLCKILSRHKPGCKKWLRHRLSITSWYPSLYKFHCFVQVSWSQLWATLKTIIAYWTSPTRQAQQSTFSC